MKKKYLLGSVFALFIIAIAVFLVVLFGRKHILSVTSQEGCTVTIKDITLNEEGMANINQGDNLVFAVMLDAAYSDSNVVVKINDTDVEGKNGVYRHQIDGDTVVVVEGVTKNDHIVQGIDMEEASADEGYAILRDKEKRPIPVLGDVVISGVDRQDVPNLDLTASVYESVNPGWKFRELNAVNLGKYEMAKFYVKHSNYLEAKMSFGTNFYEQGGNDNWHEFLFKNDKGIMTLYVDGEKIGSVNYLSDIQFCLQDSGSYKFSHIYVVPKDDYKGAMLTVETGEGYTISIPSREYAIGATLQFVVTIDENFMKGSSYSVRVNNETLKEKKNGTYTFEFKKDATLRVMGVVPKPLDSRFKVLGTPMVLDMEKTDTYILVKSVKGAKTYTFSPENWMSFPFHEMEMKEYEELLFFIKKEDEEPDKWLEIAQYADDGTMTPYLQTNNADWHRVEIKKEAGQMYFYIDGERKDVPIIDAEHLAFTASGGLKFHVTSLLGIKDKNYVPPKPDYISTAYVPLAPVALIDGTETKNYVLVSKTKNAKTYTFTAEQWRSFGFANAQLEKYKSLIFFVQKEDENAQTWLEFYKKDKNGALVASYISTNDNKWHKVELKKNSKGKFVVYVDDTKKDGLIESPEELLFTLSANATLNYTSLCGMADPNYKEPEPEYIAKEYQTLCNPLVLQADEIQNYVLISKTAEAKTYQYNLDQWRAFGFVDVNMAKYKSFVFFVHKDDENAQTWLELYKGVPNGVHEADYIAANDNKWYKVELKKNSSGKFDVYVNKEKHKTQISDITELTLTASKDMVLMFTSLFGVVDPSYKEPEPEYISTEYETIHAALDRQGEEVENYLLVSKTPDAKTYRYTPDAWRTFGLSAVNEAKYQSLLFFVQKEDVSAGTWLELYKGEPFGAHQADYISTTGNDWYKIELKKTDAGIWAIYVNDVKQESTVSSLAEFTFTISANAPIMYTSMFGIKDPSYKEPEEEPTPEPETEKMIVTSPWAYSTGNMDNSQTYTSGGFEYATIVPGGQVYYDAPFMMDVDLTIYKEFRFALKTNGNYWYEICKAGAGFDANNLFAGNQTEWMEYTFKYEGEKDGKPLFRLYKNGNYDSATISIKNLSDLQMRFSANENAVLYMTEVRGTLKDGAKYPWKILAPSFNDCSGERSDAELPSVLATEVTKATTTWSEEKTAFADVSLDGYQKILFYARQYEGSGFFESDYLGTEKLTNVWAEMKLIKTGNNTWDVYRGGRLVTKDAPLNNLNQIHAAYGDGKYLFSQVFGVEGDENEPEPGPEPQDAEHMVVISPWAHNMGTIDHSKTYTTAGYEYATIVAGGQVYYDAPLMMDADLSVYKEFRFALKTNGNYWYEICKAGAGFDANNLFAGNSSNWVEYTFKFEDDGTGNPVFRLYKDGQFDSTTIPADLNLSDLQMRFSSNSDAILTMTEVRGTLKEGEKNPLSVLAGTFNLESGTEVTDEKPNVAATKATEVKTSWKPSQSALASVDISACDRVIFYARKAGGDEMPGYFESVQFGAFKIDYAWTEFKLVRNKDNTWNIYTGGMLKQSNVTIANLSEITATYGDNHYYFSEVFGMLTDK